MDNKVEETIPEATANPENSTKEADTGMSDSWITIKVKYALLWSRKVAGLSVRVSTSDRVVTLRGHLHNSAEHAAAVYIAKGIRGVKNVVAKGLTFDPDVVMRH
nr:BON domain-containing protein [Hahella ganghwensis]